MRKLALSAVLAACTPVSAPAPTPTPDAPPPPIGHDLTVTLDGIDADFVAVQDGDGAFAPVTGTQGVYRAHVAADRYGIAVGCKRGQASSVRILQRTAADGVDVHATCGAKPVDTVQLAVNVTGSGGAAGVQAAGATRFTDGDGQVVLPVARGFVEVVGTSFDDTGRVTRLARLAPFDAQASTTIPLDLQALGAALEDQPLTAAIPAGATATLSSTVSTPTGSFLVFGGRPIAATYQALPATLRRPDDRVDVILDVVATAGPIRDHRIVTSAATGPLTLALPPPVAATTPTLVATPTRHPIFAFTATAGAYIVRAATAGRDWSAELSPSFLDGSTGIHYELPDLSSVPDFASTYALTDGNLAWSVARVDTASTAAIESLIGCGDGIVQPGEACDTAGDSATCDSDCTPVVCGDGHVNPVVEQCDDGDDPESICLPNCRLAS